MSPSSFSRPLRIAFTARLGYVVVILLATLSDLYFDPSLADVPFRLARAFELTLHLRDAVDGVRNIALFGGLGVVWVVSSPSGRVWRSVRSGTIVGFCLSVTVEILQLFSRVRNSSIIDVTTNTVGTLIGALGTIALISAIQRTRGRRSFVGIPMFLFAVAYGISVMMEMFAPLLRQDLLPNLGGGVGARIGQAWAAMQLESILNIPLIDVLLFFPAGVFCVAAFAEHGETYDKAWPQVAFIGTAVSVFIEIIHGVVGQPIELGAILSHSIAIAAGAWAAAIGLRDFSTHYRGRQRPQLVLMAYVGFLMIWSWRPFIPELNQASIAEQFTAVHLIPLRAMADRVDLFSVTDIVTQFLLYLPIGAILSVWPLRRTGPWRGILPALYLSIILELGKIVVADRFLDVTHILIQMAGSAIGWILVRRSGFPVYGEILVPTTFRKNQRETRSRRTRARH